MRAMFNADMLSILRLPLRVVPDTLHNRLAASALNHLLRGQSLRARLHELEGYSICLDIRDTGTKLYFRISNNRFIPGRSGSPVCTIRGALRDFAALAARTEDADTLFFKRRLCIEGDTEAGLHVKNLIDSLDYDWGAHVRDVLPRALAAPAAKALQRLRDLRRRRR